MTEEEIKLAMEKLPAKVREAAEELIDRTMPDSGIAEDLAIGVVLKHLLKLALKAKP